MRISVVIPTLNESANLPAVISETRRCGDAEIVVADGGSKDDTWAAASEADVRIDCGRGRAAQMNAGAAAASGDVLLFLHADCRLHPRALGRVRRIVEHGFRGGCFPIRIDAPGPGYRFVESGVNFRTRLWFWAYGDQGLFVTRSTFENLGGFPPVKLMEDHLFAARLRRTRRWAVANAPILVSARRWERYGLLNQTMRNLSLITLQRLGVHPDRLAEFYSNRVREEPSEGIGNDRVGEQSSHSRES